MALFRCRAPRWTLFFFLFPAHAGDFAFKPRRKRRLPFWGRGHPPSFFPREDSVRPFQTGPFPGNAFPSPPLFFSPRERSGRLSSIFFFFFFLSCPFPLFPRSTRLLATPPGAERLVCSPQGDPPPPFFFLSEESWKLRCRGWSVHAPPRDRKRSFSFPLSQGARSEAPSR